MNPPTQPHKSGRPVCLSRPTHLAYHTHRGTRYRPQCCKGYLARSSRSTCLARGCTSTGRSEIPLSPPNRAPPHRRAKNSRRHRSSTQRGTALPARWQARQHLGTHRPPAARAGSIRPPTSIGLSRARISTGRCDRPRLCGSLSRTRRRARNFPRNRSMSTGPPSPRGYCSRSPRPGFHRRRADSAPPRRFAMSIDYAPGWAMKTRPASSRCRNPEKRRARFPL